MLRILHLGSSGILTTFLFFIQLEFTFNIIMYYFYVCSIAIRQSYSLQSSPPSISGTYLAAHIVSTTLLTIFPVLWLLCPWLFCNYQPVVLNPSPFAPRPSTPLPSGSHQSVLCVWVCCCLLFRGRRLTYFFPVNHLLV